MLQQGLPVTDVCYFIGEDAPKMTGILEPDLPDGYDYDFINSDVIMKRLSVEEGLLTLPDGKKYELMVLPPLHTMRPEMLKRIRDLLIQGARIYGPPPLKSPSLENFPAADAEIREISAEIWAETEGESQIHRKVDKGRLYFGQHLSDIFYELNVEPDVIVEDTSIRWTHRRLQGTDIYFISNQEARSKEIELSFRINGMIPEIWDPSKGIISKNANFKNENGRVKVPVKLDVHGSVFVVFREHITKQFIQNLTYTPGLAENKDLQISPSNIRYTGNGNIELTTSREGKYALVNSNHEEKSIEISGIPPPLKIDRDWNVRFPENLDAPIDTSFNKLISWPDHQHESIRHFSGTARYLKDFNLEEQMINPDKNILLDLGEVMVIAEVIVNGRNLGILWNKPFVMDITDAVHEGINQIELRITNTWWNRLVGAEKYPDGFPGSSGQHTKTYTTYKGWNADDRLMPSGLLGPVRVYFEKKVVLSQ
jgi:hypothetical protein